MNELALFAGAVAAYSADTTLAGELSAPSNGNPTQQAYCAPDKMMAFSRLSRFGMTCKPLTDDLGEVLLTSYLAAFRARTSAPPARAPASTASAPACGSTWPELSVKYCLASSSWKTHRSLWEEDLPWSSVTLPRWGMTRNGRVLEHPTAERPICATASGLWDTPSATDGTRGGCITENMTGTSHIKQINTPNKWPTPKENDAEKGGNFDLNNPRNGLPAAVRKFPTPTASASKGWAKNHNRANTDDRLDYTVERENFQPGQQTPPMHLNPTWVEWLMGWPLGWTDLKPLAMDRFREWQRQHSPYWQDGREET